MSDYISDKEIKWYVAIDDSKKVVATYGAYDKKLVAIAYHYDFRDFSRDGSVSFGEAFWGMVFSNEQEINMIIANDIRQRANDDLNFQISHEDGVDLYIKSVKHFLNDTKTLISKSVDFIYFNTLVNNAVGHALTAYGVTGVKKFVYRSAYTHLFKAIIR